MRSNKSQLPTTLMQEGSGNSSISISIELDPQNARKVAAQTTCILTLLLTQNQETTALPNSHSRGNHLPTVNSPTRSPLQSQTLSQKPIAAWNHRKPSENRNPNSSPYSPRLVANFQRTKRPHRQDRSKSCLLYSKSIQLRL